MAQDGIIGFNDLFDMTESEQLKAVINLLQEFKDEYTKTVESLRSTINSLQANMKSASEEILKQSNTITATGEKNREAIIKQAQAANILADATNRLNETDKQLILVEKELEQGEILLTQANTELSRQILLAESNIRKTKEALIEYKAELGKTGVDQNDLKDKISATRVSLRAYELDLKNLKKELDSNIKVNTGAADSFDALTAKLMAVERQYKSLSKDERENIDIGGQLIKIHKETRDELSAIDVSMGKYRRQVGNYGVATKNLINAQRTYKNDLVWLRQGNAEIEKTLISLITETNNYNKALDDEKNKLDALKSSTNAEEAEIKALEQNISELTTKINENNQAIQKNQSDLAKNTEIYNQTKQAAGELRREMTLVEKRIQGISNQTIALDGIIGIAQTATAAFTLWKSAATFLGIENEELQKTFVQLQAAMAMLNALQQISTQLKMKSNSVTFITLIQEKAQAKQLAILTALQNKNTDSIFKATIAQKFFNLVAKANPYVLLAIAVATVAGGLYAFASNANKAAKEQEKLNKAIDDAITLAKLYAALQNRPVEEQLAIAKQELAILEARDAADEKIFKKRKEIAALEQVIANNNKKNIQGVIGDIDSVNAKLEKQLTTLKQMKKSNDEHEKFYGKVARYTGTIMASIISFAFNPYEKFSKKEREFAEKNLESLKNQRDEWYNVADAAQSAADNIERINEETNKALHNIDNASLKAFADARLLNARKNSKEELNARLDVIEKERQVALDTEKLSAGERELIEAKYLSDRRKAIMDYNNLILNDEKALLEAELVLVEKNGQAELNSKIAIIEKERDIRLAAEGVLHGERKKIIAESEKEIADLQKQYRDREFNARKNNEIALLESSLTLYSEDIEKRFDLRMELAEKEAELAKYNVENDDTLSQLEKENELININNELIEKKMELTKEAISLEITMEELAISRENANKRRLLEEEMITGNLFEKQKARKQLRDNEEKELEQQYILANRLRMNDLISEEEYLSTIDDLDEKLHQLKLKRLTDEYDARKAIRDQMLESFKEVSSAIFTLQKERSDERLEQLKAQQDRELELAGDNEIKKKNIQDNFARLEKQEKRKQAQNEKKQAIFDMFINTAVAVTKALSAAIPPANYILAAAVAATGAIQMGLVAARPIPQYYKGTKNALRGIAKVGERGTELIENKGRFYETPSKESYVYLQGGEKIYTAKETKLIKSTYDEKRYNSSNTYNYANEEITNLKRENDVYNVYKFFNENDGVKEAFKEAVQGIPVNITILDESGYTDYTIRNGNRIRNFNKRLTTGGDG